MQALSNGRSQQPTVQTNKLTTSRQPTANSNQHRQFNAKCLRGCRAPLRVDSARLLYLDLQRVLPGTCIAVVLVPALGHGWSTVSEILPVTRIALVLSACASDKAGEPREQCAKISACWSDSTRRTFGGSTRRTTAWGDLRDHPQTKQPSTRSGGPP